MNVTMPFQTLGSQSRVEFIKKKFENPLPVDNNTGATKRSNATAACKKTFLQELKDLNLGNKTVNFKSEVNDLNKNEGKASVKRSPAFRREKLGCTKSLTQVLSQETSALVELAQRNISENAQLTTFNKAEVPGVKLWEDFKRSKTDTYLLRHCSNRIMEKKIFPKYSENLDKSNPVGISNKTESECGANKKILDQYSVVNKEKNKPDKNEIVNLKFSESIRRALQSPLPKGPPPKKPPRTFCHVRSFTQTDPLQTRVSASSAETKFDIPKLKSKLEKLEKVIRIHETGTFVDKAKFNIAELDKNISVKGENSSIPDVTETYQACLPISHCLNLNQDSKPLNCKIVSKAKSEFCLAIDKQNLNSMEPKKYSNCCVESGTDQPKAYVSSPEVIYDLPCLSQKSSFETFGKCIKDLKDSVNSKKAEGLHYMCTDVINQTPRAPNFLSPNHQTKSIEERSLSNISDLQSNSLTIEEYSIRNMKGNDKKKFIIDSKAEKGIQTIKKQDCAVVEDSSGDSESDLTIVNHSDCDETQKKRYPKDETLSEMTARRKIYLSRVSSNSMTQIPCWKHKNKTSYKHLFECCLLVGLTLCESKESMPYIKSVFPPNMKPPPLIESLCFPDACYWPPTAENHHPEEQFYSLVVTNENGERKFGYCRRVLPEGGHVCLPLAYCIISPHRAGGFFYKVLEELESRHGSPVVENFIKQLYESEFPGPGERLKLKEILEEATKSSQLDSDVYLSSTLVRRPPDVRLEEKDLTHLFRHLQLPVFLKVFSSLLLERKVLLLSNSLRNLSSCIEALQSILLPFSWQHTYIPVLPVHLIEMCEAPTPYVIGLLKPRNVEKPLTNVNFEDGILVDLDDSKILKCCGDEGSILPSRLIRDLKTSLNLAMNSSDLLSESDRSVLISDAFIRFFVQVCGNYSKYIQSFPNGEKFFQKEEFIKSVTSNTTQSFLDWFTETAMFNAFIQERLQGDDDDMLVKLFRRRAMEYSGDGVKDSAVLLKNYRVINKKVKTLGGKIKDFTSFAK